jgi:hypothetical protein
MANFLRPIRQRVTRFTARLQQRLFARELICHRCQRPIIRTIARVERGGVRLAGLESIELHVDFADPATVRFCHGDRNKCVPAETPLSDGR